MSKNIPQMLPFSKIYLNLTNKKSKKMDLKNAVVLITGGSSGLGFETAKHLIEKGSKVAITGRNKIALEKAASQIGAFSIHADVSVEKDTIAMVEKTITHFGNFNVLINNAGFGNFNLLVDTKLEDMQSVFATNVFGAMMAAREAAKYFIAKNYGNIINISSTAGRAGFASGTVYSASKFAVSSMTECWRAELRKNNIRVMQINPSEVQTNFLLNLGRENRAYNQSKLQSIEIAHTISSMLSMEDRGFITEATVFATNPI
jgi:3-oxoacyl-[acyl-carrier protein] reductase